MSRCCWAAARLGSAGSPLLLLLLADVKGRGVVARSARLCAALLEDMRSLPLSSLRARIMLLISEGERRG